MRVALIAIFLLFLTPSLGYSISINEILYNPNGTDTGHEWVEIYNNDSDTYNLTGWKLNTNNVDHTLNVPPINGGSGTMTIEPGNYVIIAQDALVFLTDYVYNGTVIDSSWPDLSNSANETIWIRNSTVVFHNITSVPISAEGRSVCFLNNTLAECTPTPGYANIQYVEALNSTNTTNSSVSNSTSTELLCDIGIDITTNSTVFGQETISFDLVVNDTNCNGTLHNTTLKYLVEDLFGSVVKQEVNTTSELTCLKTISRQWTPGDVDGSEAYYIRTSITNAGCNDTSNSNNNATKLVVVKGSHTTHENNSSIGITSVSVGSDNEIKYGEQCDVNINVYRGNTSKTSIDIFVKDNGGNKLSETTNFNVKTKFSSFNFSIPIQMKTNCDGSLADGNFTVVAEGLDTNSTKTINVRGISSATCKTTTVSSGISGGSSCSCPSCSLNSTSKSCNITAYDVNIYNQSVELDEEFIVMVKITNTFQTTKNFTVYSYAFKGSEPVTLGFNNDAGKWMAAYDSNAQDVELPAHSSTIIYLKNKIENGTDSGVYSLRARIRVDGKNNDITNQISVVRKNNSRASIDNLQKSNTTGNKTKEGISASDINKITGLYLENKTPQKNTAYWNETHIAKIIVEMLKVLPDIHVL